MNIKHSLVALFLFFSALFLLMPLDAQAIENHLPDPLAGVSDELFATKSLPEYYKYTFVRDLYPGSGQASVVKQGSSKFSVKIPKTNNVLRLFFTGDSLHDSVKISDPLLTITPSKGEKFFLRLNQPTFHFSDLKPGKYLFEIDDLGLDYQYQLNFDLVDWQFGFNQIYLSSAFDLDKNQQQLDNFLSRPSSARKVIITSNIQLLKRLGLELKDINLSKKDDLRISEEMALFTDKILVFKNNEEWKDLFSYHKSALVLSGQYPTKNPVQVIALSPDVTSLSSEGSKDVYQAINSHFTNQKRSQQAVTGVIIIAVLLAMIYLVYRRYQSWDALAKDVRKNSLRITKDNKSRIGILLITLILLGLALLVVIIYLEGSINAYLARRAAEGIAGQPLDYFKIFSSILATMVMMGLLEAWLFYSEIRSWLSKNGQKHIKLILLGFLILLALIIYSLIFTWINLLIQVALVIAITLGVWLLYLYKLKVSFKYFENNNLKKLTSLLMVLIMISPAVYLIRISYPIWKPGQFSIKYQLKVVDGKVKATSGLSIPDVSTSDLGKDYVEAFTPVRFNLSPQLYSEKLKKVSIKAEIENDRPLYIHSITGKGAGDYLFDFPNKRGYRKVFKREDDLTALASKELAGLSEKPKNIEQLIQELKDKQTFEIYNQVSGVERGLFDQKSKINLEKIYTDQLSNSGKQINTFPVNLPAQYYSFYTYFNREIDITISKQDNNQKLGRDVIYLAVYGPNGRLIRHLKLKDDGKLLGKKGPENDFRLKIKGIEKGVYNLVIFDFSGHDSRINKISLNSRYLIVEKDSVNEMTERSHLYDPGSKEPFYSFSKKGYFNPFQSSMNEPGSSSDLLVYYWIDNYKNLVDKISGNLEFTLRSTGGKPSQPIKIKNLKIEYFYQ